MDGITALKKALSLAESRKGFCAPNPAVGAVLVEGGEVIGQGYHWGPGEPHAEVEALKTFETVSETATLYVTLEPCCHHGRTPPCTDLLIQKKVKHVVYAYRDPNPIVSGRGQGRLTEAGIHCEHVSVPEVDRFYESYTHWTGTGVPFATYKLALSLDGKIAGEGKTPVKLSSPPLDAWTQNQRRRADALLTTGVTIRRDNPRFSVRTAAGPLRKALFVLDALGDIPLDGEIWKWVDLTCIHGPKADPERLQGLEERGARLIEVPAEPSGTLDLPAAWKAIGTTGVQDLWIEGGGTLLNSLLGTALLNRAYFYLTPWVLGESATSGFLTQNQVNWGANAKSIEWTSWGPDGCLELTW
jgi:diaminohydroxyphosphoribosylaminopyrimidine deaminase/5-amino-6-(5-phosphoribosylamino)uracil reductase